MARRMTRKEYVELFGPTVGDRVRLGDTELWAEVERDYLVPGDECVFGGGKTLRDGLGAHGAVTGAEGALDFVITNALVIDAVQGIVKADIGIKDGRIVGIGKAGNPLIMDGVDPNLVVGANTDVRSAEGMIATAGGIDVHVHFDSAGLCEEAIASGITTMLGGGLGPVTVGICSSGTVNLARMLQAAEAFPLNFGFLGKGSANAVEPLLEQVRAGAVGLKIHEDWGAMPAVIHASLDAGDELDVQVQIHTDTLNESGFFEHTMAAIGGRTIHTYHSEGAGGGHAPDIIRVSGEANCLPSSTNPTNPYTRNTFDEHLDMVMVCHHLNPRVPEDVAFAESRIRRETIAAEDVLHDLGAISVIGSDSQGMGRIGETIARTWQVASHMKGERGSLAEDVGSGNDNTRIKRYVAKYTLNAGEDLRHRPRDRLARAGQARRHRPLGAEVLRHQARGRVQGRLPRLVGDGRVERVADDLRAAPLPSAVGRVRAGEEGAVGHVHGAGGDRRGRPGRLGLEKRCVAPRGTRKLTKRDLLWNDALPTITVDPETYRVEVDGELCTCDPMERVPLGPLYVLK